MDPPMSDQKFVTRSCGDPKATSVDVLFVHGLSGDAHKTWTDSRGTGHWPSWLCEDIGNRSVYTLGYPASILAKPAKKEMNLVGERLLKLHREGVGQELDEGLAGREVDVDVVPFGRRNLGDSPLHQRLARGDELDYAERPESRSDSAPARRSRANMTAIPVWPCAQRPGARRLPRSGTRASTRTHQDSASPRRPARSGITSGAAPHSRVTREFRWPGRGSPSGQVPGTRCMFRAQRETLRGRGAAGLMFHEVVALMTRPLSGWASGPSRRQAEMQQLQSVVGTSLQICSEGACVRQQHVWS